MPAIVIMRIIMTSKSGKPVKKSGGKKAGGNAQAGRRMKLKDIPKGPFALARVVRIIRKNAPDHMISSNVKNSMNYWLGEVAEDVAKKMNASRYTTLNLDDFGDATKRYKIADELDSEKERLVKGLDKLQLDIDALKRDIERRIATEE